MRLCIFNPEHDLCLAKGRAHYVPPRSAVDFALCDAGIMQELYPEALCCSVYDKTKLSNINSELDKVTAWGWDAVVKYELMKRGIPEHLLPSDEEINTIRELQHRSTILSLQPDCHKVCSVEEMSTLLKEREHWVMKAPWSGAGRGLRWVHGSLTEIDRDWLRKTVEKQRCVIAEPRREVVADLALEYHIDPVEGDKFLGYSYFRTGSGVYKENIMMTDAEIESHFERTGHAKSLLQAKSRVEQWLKANVVGCYHGPLGVDLMACADGSVHVAEINFRHTMGMVAHEKIKNKRIEL